MDRVDWAPRTPNGICAFTALVGEVAWSGAESDFSASLTASDQGVDKFSVAVAADGEASDDDAYEGGLTGAVQLTVATDDDQLLTAATDDDLREAVTTLEEIEATARRVLGGSYPTTVSIERSLRNARAALRARETPPEVLQTADDLAAHFDSL